MKTVIYADILVAINIYVTWFLLIATRVFTRTATRKICTSAASVVGGLSSLMILTDVPLFLSILYKITACALIVSICFLPKSFRLFFKYFTVFLLMNFLLAGLMLLVQCTVSPNEVLYKNGAVYFDVSVLFIAFSSLGFYGAVLLFDRLLKHRVADSFYRLTLYYRGKSVTLNALFDTGNTLLDGAGGRPVTVVALEDIKSLFTFDEFTFFRSPFLTEKPPKSLTGSIRFVPCRGVGGASLLPAFLPDAVTVTDGKKTYKSRFHTIAVTGDMLGDGTYSAILNSQWFERSQSV